VGECNLNSLKMLERRQPGNGGAGPKLAAKGAFQLCLHLLREFVASLH